MFKTFSIKRFDFLLVLTVVLLNFIGIMAIGSAKPTLQVRQIQGLVIGLVVMALVSTLDYTRLLKLSWVYYAVNLVLLFLVLYFGESRDEAQRWLTIAGIRFQPAEATKLLLILFYAQFIMKLKDKMKTLPAVLGCLLFIIPPLYLVYSQPDLSTAIMIFIIFSVMLFVGGLSFKLVAAILAVTVPAFIVFLTLVIQENSSIAGLLDPYQRNRILAWLYPEDYPDIAYQTINSMQAVGSGQLTGKGYNTNEIGSFLNSGYISESQTDFIFTVIGEEFGFVGGCTVVILVALTAIQCFLIARASKNIAGSVIAAGIGAWIGFQGFMNIGVVTGVLPNTGIPLPFVSYGLTSLVVLYAGIGFVLNVRMQNK
ncbi:MAG: FtsW/RodA/SpoVE family cell cycle protein [Lachnospiraceae bacterium]|nr:FtsW/RodA/SpoVE family cell cycle protein [Lachnospiraceae bacterium]MBQ2627251.1 FtsW/RodA/SpoVE family cell cycle protein [Eubacterium sp.]MBQ6363852.1 FtsW/RodA/SpoVE family cell cycle protein [Lachnospiraceae bacterium]MBR2996300.1 FtsW/RodA/SpoVE family cell cycle protein [Lachnospiraceae bacterium]